MFLWPQVLQMCVCMFVHVGEGLKSDLGQPRTQAQGAVLFKKKKNQFLFIIAIVILYSTGIKVYQTVFLYVYSLSV